MTLAFSPRSRPQLVTKPWQKGLSDLSARIAVPIATTRVMAKPDHGHIILVRLIPVSTLGDGVFMSHSRQSIFLLNMVPCSSKISLMLFERVWYFSLSCCQEISLPLTFSAMPANCLLRCLFPLESQASSLLTWFSIPVYNNYTFLCIQYHTTLCSTPPAALFCQRRA